MKLRSINLVLWSGRTLSWVNMYHRHPKSKEFLNDHFHHILLIIVHPQIHPFTDISDCCSSVFSRSCNRIAKFGYSYNVSSLCLSPVYDAIVLWQNDWTWITRFSPRSTPIHYFSHNKFHEEIRRGSLDLGALSRVWRFSTSLRCTSKTVQDTA